MTLQEVQSDTRNSCCKLVFYSFNTIKSGFFFQMFHKKDLWNKYILIHNNQPAAVIFYNIITCVVLSDHVACILGT